MALARGTKSRGSLSEFFWLQGEYGYGTRRSSGEDVFITFAFRRPSPRIDGYTGDARK
jgi:hypothetical protein